MTTTYTMKGIDRKTGEDRTLSVEAEDRSAAERKAYRAGIVVRESFPPVALDHLLDLKHEDPVGDLRRTASFCSHVAFILGITIIGLPLTVAFHLASIHFKAQAEQIRLLQKIAEQNRD